MSLPPVDFSPLDPRDGEGHWERLAARIEAAAAPELARRAAGKGSPWVSLVARYAAPLFAAAAAITLVSAGALLWQRGRQNDPAAAALAALIGVSYESAATLAGSGAPLPDQPLTLPGAR
jgi:hypothetical protein